MPVFAFLSILFAISEIMLFILKRSKSAVSKSRSDKNSLLILWLTIPLCLTLAGFISGYGIWMLPGGKSIVQVAIAVVILGFIIRWIAIIQLGKMFTVDVSIANAHLLKTDGLYKIVRHPSYLGLMLIIGGLALCDISLLSFLVVLIPVFFAMNYRMNIEEKALIIEFGETYLAYTSRISRIIPGIY